MWIFLAALDTAYKPLLTYLPDNDLNYGLASYYYISDDNHMNGILSKINKKLLIDSGAHSFQHGKKVDFDKYTDEYVQFIKKYTNNPKIEGFFEMDVDNVIGYEKVLELRAKLEAVSDKIIPVWHNNRGVDDFIEMCKKYSGKRIAITGFANNDITDSQYNLFINEAHKYNCKVHILGLTRYKLIQSLNLGSEDSVDSSSWVQTGIFGGINLPTKEDTMFNMKSFAGLDCHHMWYRKINYITAREIQLRYEKKDNSF